MILASGRWIDDLASMTPDDVSLDDIATSLSRQVGYLGHLGQEWTTAQHSVAAASLAGEQTNSPRIARPR